MHPLQPWIRMKLLLFLSTLILITFSSPNLESLTFKLARQHSQTQTPLLMTKFSQIQILKNGRKCQQGYHTARMQCWKNRFIRSRGKKSDTWVEVPTLEATSKILPGTWVSCHKRDPTGIISKFETRYCVQGDLQDETPETYAPVVSWSTIRLVLVFTLTQSWHLIHLKDPVWIHLPSRYKSKTTTPTCL